MLNPPAASAIGIFDSGLGGLTVASAIARRFPSENLVYLGDTARVPYGTRSPATVVRYARKNVAFLREQGVKMVVVACNTVSAQGLGGLADGSGLPLIGVIRPGVRAALRESQGGAIAVLGTPATIRSGAYEQALHELEPRRSIIQLACPLFVPLVEEGWLDHEVTRAVAREYLAELKGKAVDTVILGCTHYPLLESVLQEVLVEYLGAGVTIVDSASAVAEATGLLLDQNDLFNASSNGTHSLYVTDAPDRVASVASRFWLGDSSGGLTLEHVDLDYVTP